jgi:hypothetical protein
MASAFSPFSFDIFATSEMPLLTGHAEQHTLLHVGIQIIRYSETEEKDMRRHERTGEVKRIQELSKIVNDLPRSSMIVHDCPLLSMIVHDFP